MVAEAAVEAGEALSRRTEALERLAHEDLRLRRLLVRQQAVRLHIDDAQREQPADLPIDGVPGQQPPHLRRRAMPAPVRLQVAREVTKHPLELADEERIAALILEQRGGLLPAGVLLADPVLHRHLDVVEEDFVQRVLAGGVVDRPDDEAARRRRQHEHAQSAPA